MVLSFGKNRYLILKSENVTIQNHNEQNHKLVLPVVLVVLFFLTYLCAK